MTLLCKAIIPCWLYEIPWCLCHPKFKNIKFNPWCHPKLRILKHDRKIQAKKKRSMQWIKHSKNTEAFECPSNLELFEEPCKMIKQTITLSSRKFTSMSWMPKRKKLSNLTILLHASIHETTMKLDQY